MDEPCPTGCAAANCEVRDMYVTVGDWHMFYAAIT